MAVTGAIKFFERSRTLLSDGNASASLSSDSKQNDNESIKNLLTFDKDSYYQTPMITNEGFGQIIDISFVRPIKINRLFLIDTNLQTGALIFTTPIKNITDIDNKVLQDGSFLTFGQGEGFDSLTHYWEFDEITISSFSLQFNVLSRNDYSNPPDFFFIKQIIATSEIGTFEGFPNISGYSESQNEIINMTSTGLKHITKQHQTVDSFKISFHSHPIENDIRIADRIFNSNESFTLWPCGGGYGSNHFLFEKEGWRLDDIYNVQTVGRKSNRWHKNFYKGGISSNINMVESL